MNQLQFIALLTPSVGSLVLVVLASVHSNSRITRLEHTVDQQGAELRAEIRAQSAEMRALVAEVRAEIRDVRSEIIALRDLMYRDGAVA